MYSNVLYTQNKTGANFKIISIDLICLFTYLCKFFLVCFDFFDRTRNCIQIMITKLKLIDKMLTNLNLSIDIFFFS